MLGAAALMAGTIAGFILARTVGIFGFHLTFSSGLARTVLIVEGAGVVMRCRPPPSSGGAGKRAAPDAPERPVLVAAGG